MNKLEIKGIKNIEGMKFHDIEGGFGESKKAMLVKDIAEIHERDIKDINRNINNNITRFKNGVDIIDLKTGELKSLVLEMGFTNAQFGNANNIYLLSERGYSKLLKILEDDKAWEQYEKLVDGYFNMRAELPKTSKSLSAMDQLKLQYQVLEDHEQKIDSVIEKVGMIEDRMTIETGKQKTLCDLVNKKVTAILGGKDTPAYKELNKKAFRQCWNDYKRNLDVASYKDTAIKDFDLAKKTIVDWKPNRELELMIKGCNSVRI